MFGRDVERMMEMWADLLNEIERPLPRTTRFNSKPRIGTVEDRGEDIVLSADLPGVEKKDIELSVDHNSIAFKAKTEARDYDFGQSFDFELNPEEVKATFVNGVLDVVVKKAEGTKSKTIQIE